MNVLVVDDVLNNRITLNLLLEEFESVQVSEASDGSEAIKMCREEHFDLIFMDIMMPNIDGISATRTIKSFDNKVMIIAVSALDDMESKNRMLESGAEDYITKPIEDELFFRRVENYLQIIEFRNMQLINEDCVNLFTKEVYARSLTFKIKSLQALSEFWDYYLNSTTYDIESLEDCIRIIYAYGQICLKEGNTFTIIAEENSDNLFLTLSPLNVLSDKVIQNTLLKNYKDAKFILKDHILSFKLVRNKVNTQDFECVKKENSEKLELDSEQKSILSKTHFHKVTAAEYVENTAISLMDKIEELESIENSLESSTISFEANKSRENLDAITSYLDSYIDVVDQLMEFEHLAFALHTLSDFLKKLDIASVEDNIHKKFSLLFVHLIDDISQWRKNIFILKEANDVHYLDSSLLSSCLQLQALFEEKEVEQDDEDDFELF